MPETLSTPEKPDLEKSKKDPIELDMEKAKLLYEGGSFDEAIGILEDALDKAYKEKKMDLYGEIVDLLDEWE